MSRTETRGLARTILALLAAMLVAYVLFSSGPLDGKVNAQATPTGCGSTIKWVNPDADNGNRVGSKDQHGGGNGNYHLVAWVNDVPDDPDVDFFVGEDQIASTKTPPLIKLVSGTKDTYEYFWDVTNSGFADTLAPIEDPLDLKAVLYSNNSTCSEDTESITINDEDDTPPPAASTVEIVDPPNGEEMGFYQMDGGISRGVFRVRASEGTIYISAKYSISSPGTEPAWKPCGSPEKYIVGNGGLPQGDDVACTLAAGDDGDDVTAIAAIANDTPNQQGQAAPYNAQFDDASDAHRVDSYKQFPAALSLKLEDAQGATASGNGVDPDGCTQIFVATVTDESGEPISGANVDVHAQGPTDSLKFSQYDATANTANAFKAPDKGGHGSEDASDCTGAASSTQGDHDQADIDIKHIEATNGTNNNGRFQFRLYHRTQGAAGQDTSLTAWADRDFNDRYCQEEPHANSGVGWGPGTTAPNDGLPAEDGTCPFGTPTATTTPTTTTSPSSTTTTTSTTTSTTTTTTTQGETKRVNSQLTISSVKRGFKGAVQSSNKRCEQGRRITLKKKKNGPDKSVGNDKSNKKGNWGVREPRAHGRYYAVAAKKVFTAGDGTRIVCKPARSGVVKGS